MGGRVDKPFIRVAGRPLVVHTLRRLLSAYPFFDCVVAVSPDRLGSMRRLLDRSGLSGVRLVAGGPTRAESVRNAVRAARPEARWALVHDAARPLVGRPLVRRLLTAAARTGASLCALRSVATVKESAPGGRLVRRTLDRRRVWLAQTPQVFRRDLLEARYRRLGRRAFSATDEAALFDGTSVRIRLVAGDPHNVKMTTPEDLKWFRQRLASRTR